MGRFRIWRWWWLSTTVIPDVPAVIPDARSAREIQAAVDEAVRAAVVGMDGYGSSEAAIAWDARCRAVAGVIEGEELCATGFARCASYNDSTCPQNVMEVPLG